MAIIGLFLMFALFPMLKVDGQISLTPGQRCHDRIATRVVNGVNTNAHEAPWHAVLELKKQSKIDRIVNHCGGSILSSNIVLTAAHCLWGNEVHWRSKDHLCPIHIRDQETARECHDLPGGCPPKCFRVRPEDLNVYVGVTSITQSVKIPREVKSIIIHPEWDKRSSNVDSVKSGNDLAIIVLKHKLYFSTKVNHICLPNNEFRLHSGQNVSVNGFGYITKKSPAYILQRGDLQIKTKENCIADYEKINKTEVIRGNQICAYSTSTPPIDTCQGDSGGGLLTFVGSAPVLIGIVSFGNKECKDIPGVYTNVQNYMDWIQQQWQNIADIQVNDQINLIPGQMCNDLVDLRVVNGVNTNVQAAPWHAVLELKKQSKIDRIVNHCGGTILTHNIILTAAECVWQNEVHWLTKDHLCPETARECHELPGGCPEDCLRVRPEELNVYVGITSIRQPVRIPLEVKSIIIHPQWDKRSSKVDSTKSGNNLAIIVLQNKLYFSTKINSICLPNDQLVLHSDQDVSVNGFGLKKDDRTTKISPAEILQRGDLQFKSKENCIADYEKENKTEVLQGDQICAYSTSTPPTYACQGDSGGGLITFVDSAPVLIGIVSFGHEECKDLPGVYTNVQSHMDWIEQQWQNNAYIELPNLQSESSSTINDDYDEEETPDCEVGEEYGNNCYLLIKSPLDLLSASSDCRARNGTLVSIEDSATNSFIANNITNGERAWITTSRSLLQSSDGEIISSFVAGSNIETEFIDGQDLSCAYINYKSPGKWSNDYCGTELSYVCQGHNLLIGCGGGSHGIPCCPDYINGDGKGGRQKTIDFSPKTEAGCQRSCKEQYQNSIGVTQTQDGTSKCYCEFGSPKLGGNTNKRKTCLFPTARTVQPYKELDPIPIGTKPSVTGTGGSSAGIVYQGIGLGSTARQPGRSEQILIMEINNLLLCPQTHCQVGDQCCPLLFTPDGFQCPNSC